VLTFALAGERCAIAAEDVREVLRAALPARLPKAPDVVAGVLNVRGELVPLLDIRGRFGLPAARSCPTTTSSSPVPRIGWSPSRSSACST